MSYIFWQKTQQNKGCQIKPSIQESQPSCAQLKGSNSVQTHRRKESVADNPPCNFYSRFPSPGTVIVQDSSENLESLWHCCLGDYKYFQITIPLSTWYGREFQKVQRRCGRWAQSSSPPNSKTRKINLEKTAKSTNRKQPKSEENAVESVSTIFHAKKLKLEKKKE